MTDYHVFTHVERLNTPDAEGILEGKCYISPKLDGTNASIYYDKDTNELVCGSRKRVLTPEDDNAGFANWFYDTVDESGEASFIACLLADHPNFQVFGEWLGSTKFVGHIKTYDPSALKALWIFDIFDLDENKYLHPDEIEKYLNEYSLSQWHIPNTIMENPTNEDILRLAQDNHFLMVQQDQVGEGVVIRNPEFINKYGHYVIGKYVLQESKPKPRVKVAETDVEAAIVAEFVTNAELGKAVAKTTLYFELDEFNITDHRCIGFYLNEVFDGCILDEMKAILKRFKMPTINFGLLRKLTQQAARDFIGL